MRTYNWTSGPCNVTRRDLVESNHAQRTSADRVLLCFFLGILCLQHPASSAAERLFGHRARLYNLQRPCAPKSLWQLSCLPRAVVEVRVPRGPGAVEGERQLLVVLVLLTPHPEGGEHLSLHKAKKGVRIGPRLRQETNANSRHSLRTRMLCGLARLRRSPAPRACNPVPSLQARGRAQDTGVSPKGQPQGQHAGAARSSFARRL